MCPRQWIYVLKDSFEKKRFLITDTSTNVTKKKHANISNIYLLVVGSMWQMFSHTPMIDISAAN